MPGARSSANRIAPAAAAPVGSPPQAPVEVSAPATSTASRLAVLVGRFMWSALSVRGWWRGQPGARPHREQAARRSRPRARRHRCQHRIALLAGGRPAARRPPAGEPGCARGLRVPERDRRFPEDGGTARFALRRVCCRGLLSRDQRGVVIWAGLAALTVVIGGWLPGPPRAP